MQLSSRKKFSPEEDELLKKFVKENGTKSWAKAAELLEGRTPRQCRDRHRNYLKEGLNSHSWTNDEDALILKMVNEIGPKWVAISKMLIHRNGIDVKNRWNEINSNSKFDSVKKSDIHTISSADSNKNRRPIKMPETNFLDTREEFQKQNSNTLPEVEKTKIQTSSESSIDSLLSITEEEFYDYVAMIDFIPIDDHQF